MSLAQHWTLDPAVDYLNHGSFGATPRAILERQSALREEMEREPEDFLFRTWRDRLAAAREALGRFVGAGPDDLAWVTNATSGVNVVLRSLRFEPGDELLTTDHAYGACRKTLEYVARERGLRVVTARVPWPIEGPGQVLEAVRAAVTPRTRLALLDHVTSPTGLVFPVEALVAELQGRGIDVLVDGAHALGMLPLDLDRLGAAYYTANAHKWLCAPKGAGFLWARPEHQEWIEPLVVSWGYHDEAGFGERHGWQGTRDPAAYLAVPTAIEAHATFDLERARAFADEAERVLAPFGLRPLRGERAPLMRALTVRTTDPGGLWQRLYDEHRVEVPVYEWEGTSILRVSIGPYNDEADLTRLAEAVREAVRG